MTQSQLTVAGLGVVLNQYMQVAGMKTDANEPFAMLNKMPKTPVFGGLFLPITDTMRGYSAAAHGLLRAACLDTAFVGNAYVRSQLSALLQGYRAYPLPTSTGMALLLSIHLSSLNTYFSLFS